jgi:N-acetylmuramoyl-L-alanine amidase
MRILVLDPGHGGANFGTRSFDGSLVEKDLTLDWAKRVQRTIGQQTSNWTVLLTRTNDVELTGLQRVAFADAAQADLFISLHFNSVANNAGEAGLETYCTTPLGLPSNLTREFEDNLSHLYPNNQFDENNLYYALGLHRTLVRLTGGKDRGLRRARFMTVVREQTRPAVLIEGGYLSNPREARLIATPEFRQRLADAIVSALLELDGRVNLNGK